ncbi:MAG: TrmH family RNA methyltransferase [Bacteroidales bacterium]
MIEITSARNERIKEVATLLEKSKARRTQELFVVEGLRELFNCIRAGYSVESLFFNTQVIPEEDMEELLAKCNESARACSAKPPYLYTVTKDVYSKIAYREGTEGVVAVVREKRLALADIVLPNDHAGHSANHAANSVNNGELSHNNKQAPSGTTSGRNPLILVIESVEKPGNLGALLRTADACGVDAVLVCDPLTDLYNPNLIRASLGGIFTKQVATCTNEEAYNWLSANKITILTAQLQDSRWYYDTDMVQPCAIVMGSEAEGLSDFWRKVSNARIKIPMLGELDSLNVSVSAAVLCYEAVRQRNCTSFNNL